MNPRIFSHWPPLSLPSTVARTKLVNHRGEDFREISNSKARTGVFLITEALLCPQKQQEHHEYIIHKRAGEVCQR